MACMRKSKRMALQEFLAHVICINIIYSSVIFFLLMKRTRSANSMAKPNCQEKCGNVSVPYPFGIGRGCYLNKRFEVKCNQSPHSASLSLFDTPVFQISMDYVRLNAIATNNMCQKNSSSGDLNYEYGPAYYENTPFKYSHTHNKLVGIGCDIFAYITAYDSANYTSGCVSLCPESWGVGAAYPHSCSGNGCCQTGIPKDLTSIEIGIYSMNTKSWASQQCAIVILTDSDFSQFTKFFNRINKTLVYDERLLDGVSQVLNWVIDNISCPEAQRRKDYACGLNSECIDSTTGDIDGMGYRCRCSQGYQGNPYILHGCKDIDECKDPKKNSCPKGALCINTVGSYLCTCKSGYHSIEGNGIGCIPDNGRQSSIVNISLGIGITIGILVLIAIGLWLYRKLVKRQKNKIKQKLFKRNGGLLLQQQVSSSNESVVKTKIFISEELEKATDNFNGSRVLGKGGLGTVYKGMLSDGSIVAIKKSNIVGENQIGQFINEVIILSHISHRNIVKLLGCCLETEVPLLVYEYISNGTLSQHLHDEGHALMMSWNKRLRIAGEIAGALAYLHSYASISIFHRDVKSSNIFLDENCRAVVSDFGLSRSMPLDKTHLSTLVGGTFGYLDPEYFRSGQLTDKSDVYSFSVVLAELLTGKKAVSSNKTDEGLVLHFQSAMKQNRLFEILETVVVDDGNEDEIQAVAALAKRCLKLNARKRPNMKVAAAELDQLRRIQEQPLLKHNSLGSYCSVSDRSYSYTTDRVEEES